MVTSEGAAYVFLLYVIQFIWHVVAAGIGALLDPEMMKSDPAMLDDTKLETAG